MSTDSRVRNLMKFVDILTILQVPGICCCLELQLYIILRSPEENSISDCSIKGVTIGPSINSSQHQAALIANLAPDKQNPS